MTTRDREFVTLETIVDARRKYFGGDSRVPDIQALNALYAAHGRGVIVERLEPRIGGATAFLSNAADIENIVAEFLRRNGFDGLYYLGCACSIDNLLWCGAPSMNCRPGYRRETPDDPDGFDFRIGSVRYTTDHNAEENDYDE